MTSPELTAAQSALATSTANLASTISSVDLAVDALLATYSSNVAAAQTAFTSAGNGALSGYQATSQATLATYQSSVSGVFSTAQSSLDALASSAQAAETTQQTLFSSQYSTLNSTFQSAKASAQASLDSTVAGATAAHDTAYNAAQASFDAATSAAEAAFSSAVSAALSTFNSVASSADSLYQASSASDYAQYQSAIGAGSGGREETFNNDVAAAAASRNAITSLLPSLTFDLSALLNDPDVTMSLMSTNQWLDYELSDINNDYDQDIDSMINSFFYDQSSPGGAQDLHEAASDAITTQYNNDVQSAENNLDQQVNAAQQTFSNQVNGPGGLLASFTSAMNSAVSTYNSTSQLAQQAYSSAVSAAETAHSAIVTSTRSALDSWFSSNSHRTGIQSRRTSFETEINGYISAFTSAFSGSAQNHQAANSAAQAAYSAALSGLQASLSSASSAADSAFNTAEQAAHTTYQSAENAYYTAMMNAMMNGDPMPDPSSLNQAVKDYYVAVADAEITRTTSLASATTAFLNGAFGAQATRDNQYITNGKTDALSAISTAVAQLSAGVSGQSSYLSDLAGLYTAYQTDAQGQVNSALQAVAGADVTLQGIVTSAGKTLGLAKSAAQEGYANSLATNLKNLRTGVGAAGQSAQNTIASALGAYQNAMTTAETTMVNAQTGVDQAFFTSLVAGIGSLSNDFATNEVNRAGAVADKVVTWMSSMSSAVASEFITQNGSTADATTVGNAWVTYLNAVANKWRDYVNGCADDWKAFVNADTAAHSTMMSVVLPAETARIGSVVAAYAAQQSATATASSALVNSMASADVSWLSTVAPAEQNASQSVASAARSANDGFMTAMHGHLGTLLSIADGMFSSGLPLLQTAATQLATAGQAASNSIVSAGSALLSSVISARQTRDQDLLDEEESLDSGLIGEAVSVAQAAAQVQVDQAVVQAAEARDNLEATPAAQFAGLPVGGGGGMYGMMLWAILGATPDDYVERFLDTITDADLKALLKKGLNSQDWAIHHTYQQAQAVQDFLHEMKGAAFNVHDPMRTVAIPQHVHKQITAEQLEFWRSQWNAIPDAQKVAKLGGDAKKFSIANVIAATHSKDKAALLGALESMIKDQEKFFSPYWLTKNATVADLNKLAGKLGVAGNTASAVFSGITGNNAKNKFLGSYGPRVKELIEQITGAQGKISNRLKTIASTGTKLAFIGLVLLAISNDMALAGDPSAPQWQEAYTSFQAALDFQYANGYPSADLTTKAKESISSVLQQFQTVDPYQIYGLEIILELELSKLR